MMLGCSKNDISEPQEPQIESFKRTVQVTFTKDVDTKTAIEEGDNKASYVWTQGDEQYFKVWENNTQGEINGIVYSEDMKKATLTVTFNTVTASQYVYKAKFAKEYSGNSLKIQANQSPTATSYDPSADVMYTEDMTSPSAKTSLQFVFHRTITVNKMTLKGMVAGEKVSKVEITFDKDVTGLFDPEAGIYALSGNKLTLSYNNLSVDSEGNFPVYFTSAPVQGIALTSIVVTTDRNTYNRNTFSQTYSFAIGTMVRFGINMNGYGHSNSVTDVIISDLLAATSTNYTNFSGVTVTSSAVYAGNSAKTTKGAIQLRSNNSNSGIVTTTSGGRVAKIKVTWDSETASGRVLDIYAKNTAYSSAEDLYSSNASTKGIKVGSIVCGTSTEFTFEGDFTYVGLRSNSGAMYITKIEIIWGYDSGGSGGDDEEGYDPTGWLELPSGAGFTATEAVSSNSYYYKGVYRFTNNGVSERNYSYLYEYNTYTSLWVAYPLTASHISGSASTDSWAYNTNIAQNKQINVVKKSYPSNYNSSIHSRGHQIPSADRKQNSEMNAQTYVMTNQTPQIQNKFNSPFWSDLEGAVRNLTSSTDTVYVATGAVFQTVGGSEDVGYLTGASGITPSSIPVPNYYWKVLLKVKRNSSGKITSALTIGFWTQHVANPEPSNYSSYATSVSQIETYTGFSFFANLPDELKEAAKSNTSWSQFQSF